jgi:pyruvate ferredoxin oxidoreductase beta subunit
VAHLFRPAERTEVIARIRAAADRNIARFGLMPEDISIERAAGSIPVVFSGWVIDVPAGFGLLGSLADHGIAEFVLVLNRQ